MAKVQNIPLSEIDDPFHALRKVNKETESYQQFLNSVKTRGILTAISVRLVRNPDTGVERYQAIDGLHRLTACRDLGLSEIPAIVVEADNNDVLHLQIVANAHKIDTKPVEYSRQLQQILEENPTYTVRSLAASLSKTPQWLYDRLNLTKLSQDISTLVDEGKINLSNAFALSKLPPENQAEFVQQAQVQSPAEFVPTVGKYKKELEKANRAGKNHEDKFVAVPHGRKFAELKAEYETPAIGPVLCEEAGIGSADGRAGFALGVAYAVHMDSKSVAEGQAKFDERKAKLAKDKEEAAKERDKKRARDQILKGERLKLELAEKEAGRDPAEALAKFDKENGIEAPKPKIDSVVAA